MNDRMDGQDLRTLERRLHLAEASLKNLEDLTDAVRAELKSLRNQVESACGIRSGRPLSPADRAILRWETEGGALREAALSGDRCRRENRAGHP